MSVPAATAQKSDSNSGEMQSAAVAPSFIPSQSGKIPGRKRGRPPLRSVAKMDFSNRYSESLPPLKVPKKRGRKPGFKVSHRGDKMCTQRDLLIFVEPQRVKISTLLLLNIIYVRRGRSYLVK